MQKSDNATPLVSIVVATAGRFSIHNLLDSIQSHSDNIPYEVILVTSQASIDNLKDAQNFNNVVFVFEPEMRGCVKAFNLGFKAAKGKYIVHLNDDCEVCAGWLTEMLDTIRDRNVLGAFYVKEPGTDFIINELWGRPYANFGMIKKSLMEKLGYWDESFVHYGADPDFGLKVWHAGYAVVSNPKARVIHYCAQDEHRKEDLREPASTILQERWRGIYFN